MTQEITENAFKYIISILRSEYGFDDLDVVEFAMKVEERLQVKIPDHWYVGPSAMKTVRILPAGKGRLKYFECAFCKKEVGGRAEPYCLELDCPHNVPIVDKK